jgi:hypothetical protein
MKLEEPLSPPRPSIPRGGPEPPPCGRGGVGGVRGFSCGHIAKMCINGSRERRGGWGWGSLDAGEKPNYLG